MARCCYVIGPVTAILLSVVPMDYLAIWLSLFLAGEIVVVIMLGRDLRQHRAAPVIIPVAADREPPSELMRGIVPHLRSRHPEAVIEAQRRWREAAQARRRMQLAS